ncbi:uncharacterized protein PRCAT00001399001 [Priceomyces carsonii]|uniref:uncharacterized protein n=1 Tax=Priceomyces carsonii TaxID=28549 RepID=UPI002ED97E30|nr:unnamed protein product [Priceomyces carsonii]
MTKGHEAINPIHPSMIDKMDPDFIKLYNEHVANTPNKPIDLPLLRKNYSKIYSYGTGPSPDIKDVKDIHFKSSDGYNVRLRVYTPNGVKDNVKLPVHIDFHGGGWGLGDLDTESHIIKHYVELAQIAVVDVDYRLVPEHPFPTGLKDCFEAVKYVYNNADELGFKETSISIGGVSAGGNICLAISHLCRDIGLHLVACIAGTPQVDDILSYQRAEDSPYPSNSECQFAPTLNWSRLKWFDDLKWMSLSADEATRLSQLKDIGWFKSIITAPNFSNLPKTVIFTAGCDPMRDEGEAYGVKLIQHGNEVVFKRYPGVPHPFMHMDADLWQASDYIKRTAFELALAHRTIETFV